VASQSVAPEEVAAPLIVILVFAIGAVGNKNVWRLGPGWCAQYMVIKYMLYMKDGSCSSVAITTGVRSGSEARTSLSDTLNTKS
jgi:hypothetical protein